MNKRIISLILSLLIILITSCILTDRLYNYYQYIEHINQSVFNGFITLSIIVIIYHVHNTIRILIMKFGE